ncbi:aminotransferase class I/II-fold pyridoxal phosphate-dependent enzyme [Clostridium botulinum]|uniref:Aminotransferase n=1 Tax=Clostridium botulinum (strain Langeland / NCTC 10281 / Type F) TaxID=441772 RepID=A7GI21_CLOBL|nr:aminotransferase class I/II-fold pyridoxal phosphate-dependent enzyme [Clostridium botulinum]ABS42037.1 aminotransferase, classes I and II [Clostridium botulinum F str. Langeland]KKM40696.1 aspartate aminotransferase [Clostridium botulinum]MBD5644291.1 aminotransferase class I/II-fold pyridoxal phosphate-dependent enzyme [Clostridium botulinum]MBY6794328.1 aminotransferase class I/II-fold pyridoxal phosphate-dependent enzyme [Clostridium botulinum]MBY6938116.1 aminotransferase class I/II-fo
MDYIKAEEIISEKVKNIEISGIRRFFNKVSNYKDVISLTLGQPDFKLPNRIKEELVKSIEEDKTTYTANAGLKDLRLEIEKYLKTMDINYNSEEICITVGGSEGLMCVFSTLLNEGDKVLIPTPAYPAYESCVKLLGGEILNYKLKNDFSIDFLDLENIIKKEKPKVMVLSYPSNPTGAILSKEESCKLHKIIKENNIIVISDEMYASLCFEEKYYSIAQFEDIKDKVILVSGFSKMFSMTGLRIGYVCANDEFINSIIKVHQYNVSCAPSICQWGAYAGLKYCMKDVDCMKEEFIKRRDFVYDRLKYMGIDTYLPNGAFYMFPSIKKYNMTSEEFCEKLLKEAKVAIVPGSAFGEMGEGYIRISYAYSMEELNEALNRMEAWLSKITM